MQVGLRLPECDQCTAHHTLVLDAIQSLAEEAVHEKQLQVPVLGALNVAEFASNVMEHKKTPHVLSLCVYIVHVPMHNTPFLNLSHPLCSRGKHSPSHAEEVIFCHQSHWWSQGCRRCFCPLRAPSLPTQTLSVLFFFSPFPTLRKEKGNLRRFLCQKPFSSIRSNCNMKLFAQPLPPGCCLLLVQPATATSSATSSVDEWLHLCFWSQIPITALSFAPFHSCSLVSREMKKGGILMFLDLWNVFSSKICSALGIISTSLIDPNVN